MIDTLYKTCGWVRGIFIWPYDIVARKVLIPILTRRALRRLDLSNTRTITYMSVLGYPLAIKIKWEDRITREAASMRYLEKNTSIPIPKIYDEWIYPRDDDVDYAVPDLGVLVMEHLPGRSLRLLWNKLSFAQKTHIFKQLRPYLMELRSLPQPEPVGRVGPVLGQCFDERLSDDPFGPFDNERDFNDWRISTHDWQGRISPRLAELFRTTRMQMRNDHKIVFTHGDLHLQNILVDIRGSNPDDAHVVALIDWEMSGWMPEYWEPIKMMHGQRDADWCNLVLETFPGYETEIKLDMELVEVSGRPG